MAVPINVIDYTRDCNSFITFLLCISKHFCMEYFHTFPDVLSNDSLVAYVDFSHNSEGGKIILKASVITKPVSVARGISDGGSAIIISLIDCRQ